LFLLSHVIPYHFYLAILTNLMVLFLFNSKKRLTRDAVIQVSLIGKTYADFPVAIGMNLSKEKTGIPKESFPQMNL